MISESLFRRRLEVDSENPNRMIEDRIFIQEVGSQMEQIHHNFMLTVQSMQDRKHQLRQEVLRAVAPNVFIYTDGTCYFKCSELVSFDSQQFSYSSNLDSPNVINFESDSDKDTDKQDRQSNRDKIRLAIGGLAINRMVSEAIDCVLNVLELSLIHI